jgi:hypothetical protein
MYVYNNSYIPNSVRVAVTNRMLCMPLPSLIHNSYMYNIVPDLHLQPLLAC